MGLARIRPDGRSKQSVGGLDFGSSPQVTLVFQLLFGLCAYSVSSVNFVVKNVVGR